MIKFPGSYVNPFSAKLVESLKRAQRERETRATIFEETKAVVERAFDAHTFVDVYGKPVTGTARRILEAGARRRGEIQDERPSFPDTEAGRRAKLICNAARRSRGQEEFK